MENSATDTANEMEDHSILAFNCLLIRGYIFINNKLFKVHFLKIIGITAIKQGITSFLVDTGPIAPTETTKRRSNRCDFPRGIGVV